LSGISCASSGFMDSVRFWSKSSCSNISFPSDQVYQVRYTERGTLTKVKQARGRQGYGMVAIRIFFLFIQIWIPSARVSKFNLTSKCIEISRPTLILNNIDFSSISIFRRFLWQNQIESSSKIEEKSSTQIEVESRNCF